MFAYIDEAGNTGKNNADLMQPVFSYMTLASKTNLDLDLDNTIRNIFIKYNISELHGAEQNGLIEFYARDILNLLRENSVSFCTSIVEKEFLSYAKLYDTIFDNVENKGARFQTYQIRSLRFFMLSNLCGITPIKVAHNFYENCLFAKNEDQAIRVLISTCNSILENIHQLQDERSKEIIGDALTWAIENPEAITTFNTRKIDRWRHLPHIVGFLPMMSMLSLYSRKHKSKINKIIHDEQQQVKKVISEIHRIASDPKTTNKWDLRENGFYELSKIKNTQFVIKDSTDSYGLQVVDICLYVIMHQEHILTYEYDLPNTKQLLDYIQEHNTPFLMTMASFQLETKLLYKKIMNTQLTKEDMDRGIKIVAEIERKHQEQEK
ncbi:DUF3800 domain-containing protein [Treponema vincentii]|uniref:DUF3800 domain-containing protein n=1 Tax=Treponema vincentii TaxID=69710 RepID=UPI0020A5DB25|nr:DUF3800 domain-containing protein [Treponema vincentii]UTC45142.1 DUF3800 domain-containing protein [Treponema vincentii]